MAELFARRIASIAALATARVGSPDHAIGRRRFSASWTDASTNACIDAATRVPSRAHEHRPGQRWPSPSSGGLVLVIVLVAVALASCGGSSSSNAAGSPTVASLPASSAKHDRAGASTDSGARSSTALPRGNATRLVDEWAACVRAHRDPNQADPNSPRVVKISTTCGNKLGLPLWWSAGWGPPGDVSVSSAGLNPNSQRSLCAYKKGGCAALGPQVPGADG